MKQQRSNRIAQQELDYTKAQHRAYFTDINNWFNSPNRSTELTYFTGNPGGLNPSSSTDNIQRIDYKEGDTVIKSMYFKYDASNNVLEQRNYPF